MISGVWWRILLLGVGQSLALERACCSEQCWDAQALNIEQGLFTYKNHDWVDYRGRTQSPIDLPRKLTPYVETVYRLSTTSRPMPVKLHYGGCGTVIQGSALKANTLEFEGGQRARLREIHFHAPAEHTVGGTRHAGELHAVFVRDSGSVAAVVGLILAANPFAPPNQFLQTLSLAAAREEQRVSYPKPSSLNTIFTDNSPVQ
eukprot:Protomagalhaensia_wolfi_Nauph_80__2609@NODE_2755_length_997_cov_195_160752_g2160_i0_p1_GENE_NODE_2755_length_997_cov_195_160752_g2160_i0NODE_2755_length_997_cov_195_160752_g2160_i0_p1_ORF_typecomplete_len203_score37_26Carb_anhydrase/PF00194_21/7_2e16_NODE_2755_length_997_cov_195_160752_g2160_i0344952